MTLKTIKIVPEHIVAIKIYDRSESNSFVWKNEKKIFNRYVVREEGYYNIYYDDLYTEEEILKEGLLIENKIVYNKPFLRFVMINGDSFTKEFNTMELLNSYLKDYDIDDLVIEI